MAIIIILLSIVLAILTLGVAFFVSKTNQQINHTMSKINISSSKPIAIGALVLIAASALNIVYIIVELFTEYNANWISNSTSFAAAISQAISVTILILYIIIGVSLFKQSATLLFISPAVVLILTLIKAMFFQKRLITMVYNEYFVFLPTVIVMISLFVIINAIGGVDKVYLKYQKLIKFAPWLLNFAIINNVICIISPIVRISYIDVAISCIVAIANSIAFALIFKNLIALIKNTNAIEQKAESISNREKWIVALSILLLPLIVNIVSGKVWLRWTVILVLAALVVVFKLTDAEKASVRKKVLIYTAIIVTILCVVSMLMPKNNNNGVSCGHPSCEENGPFPCYGKNNTCKNTTNCYKDLYCDECD